MQASETAAIGEAGPGEIVAIAIVATRDGSMTIWSWLILGSVIIVDATVTLVTRMLKKEDWLSAHRNHAYQIASRRFGGHSPVTLGIILINVVWLLPMAHLASVKPGIGWLLTLVAWVPLLGLSMWFGAGRSDT